jgi:hypothetical protein
VRTPRVASKAVVAAVSWALASLPCSAAPVVGSTTFAKPGVYRNSAGTTITLSPGAPVESDDLVNTDREGRAKLRFLDGSNLDIGPGSEVKIDRFVYNPNRSAVAGAVIALARGVLRFTSKGAPDRAYQFKTATSTLGIRGTDFGLAYDIRTAVTTVQTFQGAVEVCAHGCVLLKGSGGVNTAIIDANGNIPTSNRAQPSGDQTLTFGMQAGVLDAAGNSLIVTTSFAAGPPILEAALVLGAGTGIAVTTGMLSEQNGLSREAILALSRLLSNAQPVPPASSPLSP